MARDVTYTDGVIAVRENGLLKDKIFKLCETDADETLRALTDSGFNRGAEVESPYEYEKLLQADERELDEFIREYAPTNAEREYFLLPRDFHNAKALVKAAYLGEDAVDLNALLAPDGLYSAEILSAVIKGAESADLCADLRKAIEDARALIYNEEEKKVSGAEIGIIFDRALYKRLAEKCKNRWLKKLTATKIDMTNIITALRSGSAEVAVSNFLYGGKLSLEKLSALAEGEDIAPAAEKCGLGEFLKLCLESREKNLPFTQAEKRIESLETELLAAHKYELKGTQPFLYYVFRRRAENANVRILFACLLAGASEQEVKKRLRAF